MAEPNTNDAIDRHYGARDAWPAIQAGLRAMGKDLAAITPDDLALVDQFHIRGKPATMELAHLAGLQPGANVLDVGGGLGGPARTLATEFGCTVTVLDLTEAYCRLGEQLTALTRLQHRVSFRHGSALEIPFEDASFDVAWTQHSSMNIEDKQRLYEEIHRVVRPGGTLALHEIMAGPVQPAHYPAPWASEPSISFLRPPAEIRAIPAAIGFKERAWEDVSAPALEWFRERVAANQAAQSAGNPPPPLGLHLLIGPNFGAAFANLLRNISEDRLTVIEGVFER